ncbi:MAG: hypothetical protein ACRDHD_11430 [Candidatus Limnocylindria bacterium]
MTSYTTIQHPTSGENYAVEIDGLGDVVRAAGPLHHSDPTDPTSLRDLLDNQGHESEDDGTWLREQLS